MILFEKRRKLMNAWADYCAGGKEGKSRRVQTTSKLILVAANHLERKGPPQLVGDDNCACSSSPLLTSFISCATLHIYIYQNSFDEALVAVDGICGQSIHAGGGSSG